MIDIVVRLQNAMHEESAAHSPRTTAAIEVMRDAITEIGRLQAAIAEYNYISTARSVEIDRLQETIAKLRTRVELIDK